MEFPIVQLDQNATQQILHLENQTEDPVSLFLIKNGFQNPRYVHWGLYEDFRLRAYMQIESLDNEIHLHRLVVDKACHRMGFGEQLLLFLIEQYNTSILYLEVSEKNFPAFNLYKKMGFAEYYQRPRYYKNGDKAILMKRLGDKLQ